MRKAYQENIKKFNKLLFDLTVKIGGMYILDDTIPPETPVQDMAKEKIEHIKNGYNDISYTMTEILNLIGEDTDGLKNKVEKLELNNPFKLEENVPCKKFIEPMEVNNISDCNKTERVAMVNSKIEKEIFTYNQFLEIAKNDPSRRFMILYDYDKWEIQVEDIITLPVRTKNGYDLKTGEHQVLGISSFRGEYKEFNFRILLIKRLTK